MSLSFAIFTCVFALLIASALGAALCNDLRRKQNVARRARIAAEIADRNPWDDSAELRQAVSAQLRRNGNGF